MNDFVIWLDMGFKHIADWEALDHLLFITALCGVYYIQDWKKVLILVTAFTIGHSLTLALCTLDIISPNSNWVEFLIPLTIVLTALYNIYSVLKNKISSIFVKYLSALIFGLIHGMGFSSVLKSLLSSDQSLIFALFSFNIGIELGQLLVVLILLLFSLLLSSVLKVKTVYYSIGISILVLIPAIIITIGRLIELVNS